MGCLNCRHYKAMIYRRLIMIKRGWVGILVSAIIMAVFSAFVCVLEVLLRKSGETKITEISYDKLEYADQGFGWIGTYPDGSMPNGPDGNPLDATMVMNMYLENIKSQYKHDTGMDIDPLQKDSRDEFNSWVLQSRENFVNFAYGFDTSNPKGGTWFTIYYNASRTDEIIYGEYSATQLIWTMIGTYLQSDGNSRDPSEYGFTASSNSLNKRNSMLVFCFLAPMLIGFGLMCLIPQIINQPIQDIATPVRGFMRSCELTLPAYWLATFTVDFCIWTLGVMIMWIVFAISQIETFKDNLFNIWYCLVLSGPGIIIFLYCLAFLFSNPDWAIGQVFLVLLVIEIFPVLADAMGGDLPAALEWFYSIFPILVPSRAIGAILMFSGALKQDLSWFYSTWEKSKPPLIMMYVNVGIWLIVLWWIEIGRTWCSKCMARRRYKSYAHVFEEQKKKRPITEETIEMENAVMANPNFAIRVMGVCRLFFNAAGDPITAVNNVSLGVEEGTTFGFLGANGAGKTTLIQMIVGQLGISSGRIEINGISNDELTEPLVAVCPQFNNHLCMDLTPVEHFKLYSMLFTHDCDEEKVNDLIERLDFEEIKDTPMCNLSEGDCRKMAIALSFLGPAKIILLDEPTATLDSASRLHCYELIQRYKGQKTFMLCTHLLGEAEQLCDKLSIMVRGAVYTVGTPQYLSSKFGTEYKIDIMLNDERGTTADALTSFMNTNVPQASLSIERPKSRIYNVPSNQIELPDLFERMQAGMENPNNGFMYYTCSSSSLERVFMEIVKLSEGVSDEELDFGALNEKPNDSSSGPGENPETTPAGESVVRLDNI